jgi:hypothetical protein
MRLFLLFMVWFGFLNFSVFGQADSLKSTVQSKTDSSTIKNFPMVRKPDPRRATFLAVVFPGAGQIYNRKYWKLPILYGAAFTLGYYINFNNQQYVYTRDSYLQVQAGKKDRYNGAYSLEQLAQLREYWRRNRDLLIIISGFTYLLNIADAAVDAHLGSFDVSDDLSLRVVPKMDLIGYQPVFGLGMNFTVK